MGAELDSAKYHTEQAIAAFQRLMDKAKSVRAGTVAEEEQPFEFQPEHHLSAATSGYPLFIGKSYAPDGLQMKCLIVHRDCRMEVREHDGRTILTFYPK